MLTDIHENEGSSVRRMEKAIDVKDAEMAVSTEIMVDEGVATFKPTVLFCNFCLLLTSCIHFCIALLIQVSLFLFRSLDFQVIMDVVMIERLQIVKSVKLHVVRKKEG